MNATPKRGANATKVQNATFSVLRPYYLLIGAICGRAGVEPANGRHGTPYLVRVFRKHILPSFVLHIPLL